MFKWVGRKTGAEASTDGGKGELKFQNKETLTCGIGKGQIPSQEAHLSCGSTRQMVAVFHADIWGAAARATVPSDACLTD